MVDLPGGVRNEIVSSWTLSNRKCGRKDEICRNDNPPGSARGDMLWWKQTWVSLSSRVAVRGYDVLGQALG